ncbi:hypothetical protein FQN49_005852 [Arthroderma sp. PD_2]|nr:hypothetical protein FQN49_005852 [Arthroderma sp. PD_2]
MVVDYRHGVAIFSLIIYLPCFFVGAYVALRHGFSKSAGWYFLVTFSLIRTVGACLELATIANPTKGLFTAAAVCSSVGLSSLILACVGLLQRANNSIINNSQKGVPPIVFRAIALLVLLGLILGIIGTKSQDDGTQFMPNGKSKASICITLGVWVITVGLLFIISGQKKHLPAGERRLLLALAISLPFILIRLIYSLIGAFAHSRRFSVVSGDTTIYLLMAVLEEMIVVITCLAIGVTLQTEGVAAYQGVHARSESATAEEEMKDYRGYREQSRQAHVSNGV